MEEPRRIVQIRPLQVGKTAELEAMRATLVALGERISTAFVAANRVVADYAENVLPSLVKAVDEVNQLRAVIDDDHSSVCNHRIKCKPKKSYPGVAEAGRKRYR